LGLHKKHVAGIAQLVEQRIRNAKVGGSIPLSGTKYTLFNAHFSMHSLAKR
jgi:hypothetical protein